MHSQTEEIQVPATCSRICWSRYSCTRKRPGQGQVWSFRKARTTENLHRSDRTPAMECLQWNACNGMPAMEHRQWNACNATSTCFHWFLQVSLRTPKCHRRHHPRSSVSPSSLTHQVSERWTNRPRHAPLFAHVAIFWKYPSREWAATKHYDFTSLSFSMTALLRGRRHPLPAFQPCAVNGKENEGKKTSLKEWAKLHTNESKKAVGLAGFSKEWLGWCDDSTAFYTK